MGDPVLLLQTDNMLPTNILLFVTILKLSAGGALKTLLEEESEELRPHNVSARSGCPEWDELPRVQNSKFIGIRFYQGRGHDIPALSCNGEYFDDVNGYQISAPSGKCYDIGTLFVHTGCKLYGFCDYNYEGTYKTFEGPLFISKLPKDSFCGYYADQDIPCMLSYIVDCKQHYPDCVPSDEWKTVASYDNSGSNLPSTFTYKYVIGTSWSTQMSEGMSIDSTVSAEMSAGFFDIFETKIGASVTTGYNWNEVSTEAQSETREFSVQTDVPAGESILVQQTMGTCGGSNVNTEMFRSLSYDLEGNKHVSYFQI